MTTILGTPGAETLDQSASGGPVFVLAGAGADTIRGSGFADTIAGEAGGDSIAGGAGLDRAAYAGAPAPVSGNLGTGLVQDGYGGTDTLVGIEGLIGSAFADSLTGGGSNPASSDDWEIFAGLAGADTLNGGAGLDLADYAQSPAGVIVNLAAGTAQDGHGATDSLLGIEGAIGSAFADTLAGGNPAAAALEFFEGGQGGDSIAGGAGFDMVFHRGDPAGVLVDLPGLLAVDGWGSTDTLSGIEGAEGSAFADTMIGDSENNRFDGGGGGDSLAGGLGTDTLEMDDAPAGVVLDLTTGLVADGSGGIDTVSGFEAAIGSAFADTMLGSAAGEVLAGLAGADWIDAGGGIDAVDGGAGADSLAGGNGNDTVTGGDDADSLSGDAGHDQLEGGNGNDTVLGGDGNDLILAGGAADVIYGQAGNDTVDGGSGDDFMDGGPGGDWLDGAAGVNQLSYAGSPAAVTVNLETNANAGGDAAGDLVFNVTTLLGSAQGDSLTGRTLAGTALVAGGGDDGATGGTLADALYGQAGNDTLSGLGGDDLIDGAEGNDLIDGGNGRDDIHAGEGNDTVLAGEGTPIDLVSGGNGNDSLDGQGGADVLFGGNGNDTVAGGNGDDWIQGDAGNDLLRGGAGALDWLEGGAGGDTIDGEAGQDYIRGGAGNDRFEFRTGCGANVIADYAIGDVIAIERFINGTGLSEFGFIQAQGRLFGFGADSVIELSAVIGSFTDYIWLVGYDKDVLISSNFSFF